ncbi:MAG: hypothetical protein CMD22_06660 [Flavobacteriales bacterium]|nr:hypothetical protein [Flavobacteriales bacterium]
MKNFLSLITPKFISDSLQIYRKSGFKGLIKEKGWKFVFYFFMFYLIRDSIIYILIPYLIGKPIFNW